MWYGDLVPPQRLAPTFCGDPHISCTGFTPLQERGSQAGGHRAAHHSPEAASGFPYSLAAGIPLQVRSVIAPLLQHASSHVNRRILVVGFVISLEGILGI